MPLIFQDGLVDRFQYAASLTKGKRTLDIGGYMPAKQGVTIPLFNAYRGIYEGASQYECFDRDEFQEVEKRRDLNTTNGLAALRDVLAEYKPEVILCMEILEHLNYPCVVMDAIAEYLRKNPKAEAFITIPNNANWVLNARGWDTDHNVSFFKGTATRFVTRSDLGKFNIVMRPCMQTYKWYWRLIYLASFRQPINWGFHILPGGVAKP